MPAAIPTQHDPKYDQILDQPCVATVQQIGAQVDPAIVTTPPNTMPHAEDADMKRVVKPRNEPAPRYSVSPTHRSKT